MIIPLVCIVALVGAGTLGATGEGSLALVAIGLAVCCAVAASHLRAQRLAELFPGDYPSVRTASERQLFEKLDDLAQRLQAVEWDRDLSEQLIRPLDQHPLLKELSHPAELRKFTEVELYQRVLTIVAGFTRARAAGLIYPVEHGSGVVAYGIGGRRFEQHLRSLGEAFVRGDRSVLGVHDSFEQTEIWGGTGSFGHRFSHVLPLAVGGASEQAVLVWIGYAHGARPSTAECRAASSLIDSISSALHSTQRLAALDSRAQSAEQDKTEASQMLAQISHDIRTPLANVKAILHLLGEELDLPGSERTELTRVAVENCEELAELVGDVIDFTRGRAGQLVSRREAVDLDAVCRRMISTFSVAARQRGLILTFDSGGTAWVMGDATHLKRSLTNLVSNALKYTVQGEVRIRLEPGILRTSPTRVVIQDTGLGMSSLQLASLFTPFTRFHQRHAEGIGLGLAITKIFIEQHGGRILVKSAEGFGTTFTVEIPPMDATGALGLNADVPSALSCVARVLLVDDDVDVGHSLARLLRGAGFIVESMASVALVEPALIAKSFDAVVSDLNMPGGGGRAVIDIVHRQPGNKTATFILSGDLDATLVAELKARGAVEVFEKPVDHMRLVAAVRTVLDGRRAARIDKLVADVR